MATAPDVAQRVKPSAARLALLKLIFDRVVCHDG
jgi:hypothetical protein